MRRRLLLGLVPALPFGLLFAACSTQQHPLSLGVAMDAPQGLLDQATTVTLSVVNPKLAKCDPATGSIGAVPAGSQSFRLASKSCPTGDSWCATIELPEDGSTKVFAVVAKEASELLAEGCTTAVLNQNPLDVEIKVFRYFAARCCNDGKVEVGEQCDTGKPGSCTAGEPGEACDTKNPLSGGIVEDAVCNCDCTAKEILLSRSNPTPPLLTNGPVGSKSDLALAFGPGGASNPEVLRAIYEDSSPGSMTGIDLHASFLEGDLYPITDPATLDLQLEFPTACGDVLTPNGPPRDQRYPAIATADEQTVVAVYQTNQDELGNDQWDVFLSPQSPDGCIDASKPCTKDAECQTKCDVGNSVCLAAVQMNTPSSGSTDPHVGAGPTGQVLVTWTRQGGIYGRIWSSSGALTPANGEIAIAPGGAAARVAGNADGWVVVYQGSGPSDQDGIFARTVTTAASVGQPVLVNVVTEGLQDQPTVAMLPDGATLVAWRSAGNIFFQRMSSALVLGSASDQSSPLNTTGLTGGAAHANPVAAGANGFFTVAWEKPSTIAGNTDIAARFVGETAGFGYNLFSGQNDEFPPRTSS